MMLTGYAPSAEAVSSIGKIASSLRQKSLSQPGSFFWVLDPVMGDQGRLYVSEDVVPMYKQLISHADLILPNQFEAETLSHRPITDLHSLKKAVEGLHQHYKIPHVVVTSITFADNDQMAGKIAVVGSSKTSYGAPRLFVIQIPKLDCFFSGTGDMFAALMVVRLKEAAIAAGVDGTVSWVSPDDVHATELPLAKAVEKVLASMQGVLQKTMEARDTEMRNFKAAGYEVNRRYLAETKAVEVRVVRNVEMLKNPKVVSKAQRIEL
jgi:pyridoxine kinase